MERSYRHVLLVQSMLALANAAAALFGIVFLLKREGLSFEALVVFSLLQFAIATGACVALVRARPRRGMTLMTSGLAFLVSSYLAFLVLHGWPLLLFVAFAWGLYIPLFFLPFNALVVATTRTEDRAGKIGGLFLAYTAVAIVAPSLGGAIVESAGYGVLFAFAACLLVANGALVVRLGIGRQRLALAYDARTMGTRTATALFAEGGFEGLAFGVVSLIAYTFAKEELSFGGLFSLFALAAGVVSVTLGVVSDRLRNRQLFLIAGAASSALAAILVVRASSLEQFALGNSLLSLTASIAPLFLLTIAIERFPGRSGSAIATREVLLNAGRTTSLAAFFLLTIAGIPLQHAFLLATVCLAFVALGAPATPSAQRRIRTAP